MEHFETKYFLDTDNVIIESFPVGLLACTCTIIGDRRSGEAIVIDGGADAEHVMHRLALHALRASQLIHTHAHIDHIGAVSELRALSGASAALHTADLPLSRLIDQQAALLGLPSAPSVIIDRCLHDGDVLQIGRTKLTALHTPGHTPGSMCFAIHHDKHAMLFTGDTLFAGAVGRWDLGGTSLADIVASIQTKLLPYPDPTVVVPGHGQTTTIGRERATNQFLTKRKS